jgi:uncharacterized protein
VGDVGALTVSTDDVWSEARRDWDDLGRPDYFPPEGLLLRDLPLEYLAWFARKGSFPKGRLGYLMQLMHQMKVEGSYEMVREYWGRP